MSAQAPTAVTASTAVNYQAPVQAPQGPLAPVASAAHYVADKIGGIGAPTIAATATPEPIRIFTPEQMALVSNQYIAQNTLYARIVEVRDTEAALQKALETLNASRSTSSQVAGSVKDAESALNASIEVAATQVFVNAKTLEDLSLGDQKVADTTYYAAQNEYKRLYETAYQLKEAALKADFERHLAILKARHSQGLSYDLQIPVPADARVLNAEQVQAMVNRDAAVNSYNAAILAVRREEKALADAKATAARADEARNEVYGAKLQAEAASGTAQLGSTEGKGSTAHDLARIEKDFQAATTTLVAAQEAVTKLTASKMAADKALTDATAVLDNVKREANAKGV